MSRIEDYFIKDSAEDGIDIPLGRPGTDEATDSIRIRGVDSDPYRNARAKANRKQLRTLLELKKSEEEITKEEVEERKDKIVREITLDIISSLVISWTFETPCTPENVRRLLVNNPQIADTIDAMANDRSLFFGRKRSDSDSSSARKPNSRKLSRAPKAPLKNTSKRGTKRRA